MREPTQNIFLKDVETHVMHVRLDQGVYRHLEFRQANGSWNYGFHIITTPWRLMVTGDMGTWVFSRLEDMFQFFRTNNGGINCSYWAEKCVNGVHGGIEAGTVYDSDTYKARLVESLDDYGLSDEHKAKVVEELEDMPFDDEHWIMGQISNFEVDLDGGKTFTFQDVWEIDTKTYGYHFIWCLYAIAWSIQKYDLAKAEVPQ